MRPMYAILIPLFATLAPAPVVAQISATIHIGPIRIGQRHETHRTPRYVVVRDYSARNFGQWKKTARHWRPITLYALGGHYYQRPYRDARPIVVYNYRGNYFRAPHDRDWNDYRVRYERNEWRSGSAARDGRAGQGDRHDRRIERRDDRADRRGLRSVPRDNDGRPDVRARRRN